MATIDVQVVKVGDDGAFYTPNNFTAKIGTIINFQFVGTAHSVVQANFSQPCQLLPGGFDSGFAGIQFGGSLEEPMEWNLTVTDDTMPIWFYCKGLRPQSHCQNRMVGVINPPSQDMVVEYLNNSQFAPVLIQPNTTSLQGIGAMADRLPVDISGKKSAAPIIGGVVGGVGAAAVLTALILLLIRASRRAKRLEAERLAIDGSSSWLSSPSMRNGWREQ